MNNKELWTEAETLIGESELARRFKSWITNLIRVGRQKAANLDSAGLYDQDIKAILDDLNKRTGSRFQATDNARSMIKARLQQGYQVKDFIHVHEVKCLKWLGDPTAEDWLRPSTLYRQCHFDEYLSEYYAMERQKQELRERREQSEMRVKGGGAEPQSAQRTKRKAEEELINTLNSKAWWEFDTWGELMNWTVQFPTAESLARYQMPEILKKLRSKPGMAIKAAAGQVPDWVELAYQDAKKERGNGVV